MATFMGKQFAVERLVAIAGANSFIGQWPNEAAREEGHVAVPAPWVCEPGRTAASRMYSFGDLHGRVCPLWTPAQVAQRLPGVARQVEKLPGGDVESGSPPPEAAALAGLHKLCAATCWHNRSVQTLGNSKLKLGVSDHSAVAMDCCTPLVRTNTTPAAVGGTLLQQEQQGWAPLYAPVWEHMLTDEPSGPDSITGEDGRGALEDEGKPFGECGCLSYP
jgi:hypothetical protein